MGILLAHYSIFDSMQIWQNFWGQEVNEGFCIFHQHLLLVNALNQHVIGKWTALFYPSLVIHSNFGFSVPLKETLTWTSQALNYQPCNKAKTVCNLTVKKIQIILDNVWLTFLMGVALDETRDLSISNFRLRPRTKVSFYYYLFSVCLLTGFQNQQWLKNKWFIFHGDTDKKLKDILLIK